MIDYTEGSGKEYHIGLSAEDIGKYVILPGDPGRCETIANFFEDAKYIGQNREFRTFTGTLAGEKVSVVSTGIGGPSAAIALEELVHLGAHTFIRVGTSGGIQPEVQSGDLCVVTGGIRMDGTSKEYAPIEFPAVADFEVVNSLVEASKELDARYHTGIVQCKDSFYGQHEPEKMPVGEELLYKWEAWKKCGALASEMESATLFTVGSYLRVRVGAVMLVVANQERAKMGLDNPQVHDTSLAIRVAVRAIERMIEKENKKNK